MKTWQLRFSCISISAGLLTLSAVSADARTYTLRAEDHGRHLAMSVGDSLEVVLAANPTTGYQWTVFAGSTGSLRAVGAHYDEDRHAPGMDGVGGTQHSWFVAARVGQDTLVFLYEQPWMASKQDAAERRRAANATFAVTVSSAAHTSDASAALDDSLRASARRALPAAITNAQLERRLRSALWNAERTAVCVSVARPKATLVYVFLKQPNGSYTAVDASRVEGGNFGKLGLQPGSVERFETVPLRWSQRPDGTLELQVRTRSWRQGKRQSVAEPLVIRPDGTIIWR